MEEIETLEEEKTFTGARRVAGLTLFSLVVVGAYVVVKKTAEVMIDFVQKTTN